MSMLYWSASSPRGQERSETGDEPYADIDEGGEGGVELEGQSGGDDQSIGRYAFS